MKTKYNSTLRNNAGAIRFHRSFITSVCGLLSGSFLALAPSPAVAQCTQWDVSGQWNLQQSDGYLVRLNLKQNGKTVTGGATFTIKTKGSASSDIGKFNPAAGKVVGALEPDRNVTRNGSVSGTVEGGDFSAEIRWPGATGVYSGSVGGQGKINGTMYDQGKPSSQATWFGSRVMKCADAAPVNPIKRTGKARPPAAPVVPPAEPAAAATPNPIKRTGKARTETAPAGVPRIVVFNKPGQAQGTQTLTWDGGPDHPYAEVWVKVNGGDETKIVEQGKGMRQVTVEPGKTYQYILTDAGEQLGTSTATGK